MSETLFPLQMEGNRRTLFHAANIQKNLNTTKYYRNFFRLTIKSAPLFLYIFLQIRVNWAERTLKDVKKASLLCIQNLNYQNKFLLLQPLCDLFTYAR